MDILHTLKLNKCFVIWSKINLFQYHTQVWKIFHCMYGLITYSNAEYGKFPRIFFNVELWNFHPKTYKIRTKLVLKVWKKMFSNKISNIFLYFPVCRRWRAISRSSWTKFKKLELYDMMDTKQGKIDSICIKDIRIFYKAIGRVKNYLTSIKLHAPSAYFHNRETKYEINHLKILQILKNCPNIQELVILLGNKRLHRYPGEKENCINKNSYTVLLNRKNK